MKLDARKRVPAEGHNGKPGRLASQAVTAACPEPRKQAGPGSTFNWSEFLGHQRSYRSATTIPTLDGKRESVGFPLGT
jgi:hypothetical protein